MALILALAYRSIGEGDLRARAAEEARTASLIAQSRLAAVGVEYPLQAGERTGVDAGFAWQVVVRPTSDPSATGVGLYKVTVRVRPRGGLVDRAVISTLRLGHAG